MIYISHSRQEQAPNMGCNRGGLLPIKRKKEMETVATRNTLR